MPLSDSVQFLPVVINISILIFYQTKKLCLPHLRLFVSINFSFSFTLVNFYMPFIIIKIHIPSIGDIFLLVVQNFNIALKKAV